MSVDDLIRARQALAAGVGKTTRENRVLPFAALNVQIPERVGRSLRPEDVAPLCIPGDLYQPPSGTFSAPAWYTDAVKLVSTDGLWKLDKSQWKRWTGRSNSTGDVYASGSGPLIHFNFSSPATAAVAEAAADSADQQFIEGPFAERTWHDRRAALYLYSGLVGIVQRLKTIGFRAIGSLFPSGGSLLTWAFSDDSASVTGTTAKPACINRNGDEQGISTRVLVNVGSTANHISKLYLSIGDKQLYIKTYTPYGWLPSIKEPKANSYTGVSPIYYANDLARVNLLGQAYHGLGQTSWYGVPAGIQNPPFPFQTPFGYQGPGTCNTRYTKVPDLPTPPDPLDPETYGQFPTDFIDSGNKFYNDVVWFGGRHYSCSSAVSRLSLSDLQWVHIDDDGVARVLALSFASRTGSTTTFNVYNHGPLVFGQSIGAAVLLRTITISTTSPEAIAEYTGLNTTTRVAYQTGSDDVQGYSSSYASASRRRKTAGYVLATKFPVEHSPDGRKIAVFRGLWIRDLDTSLGYYLRKNDTIHTVAEFTISSSLEFSAPSYVFQWNANRPVGRVTTFTYEPYNDTQKKEMANTTMPSFTAIWCVMFQYLKNGVLNLITQEDTYAGGSAAKFIRYVSISYAGRDPMIYPDEVATDINMAPIIGTLRGFGAVGTLTISGTQNMTFGNQSTASRLANNVLLFQKILGTGPYDPSSYHLVSPMFTQPVAYVFGSELGGDFANDTRYVSYNPRTYEFGGVQVAYNATDTLLGGYCSWI